MLPPGTIVPFSMLPPGTIEIKLVLTDKATSPPFFAKDMPDDTDDSIGASRALLYHKIDEIERRQSEMKKSLKGAREAWYNQFFVIYMRK